MSWAYHDITLQLYYVQCFNDPYLYRVEWEFWSNISIHFWNIFSPSRCLFGFCCFMSLMPLDFRCIWIQNFPIVVLVVFFPLTQNITNLKQTLVLVCHMSHLFKLENVVKLKDVKCIEAIWEYSQNYMLVRWVCTMAKFFQHSKHLCPFTNFGFIQM